MHSTFVYIRIFPVLIIAAGLMKPAWGQEVSVVRKSAASFPKIKAASPFHFLEEGIDTASLAYVATLAAGTAENPSVLVLYEKLEDQARRLGANAFLVERYDNTQMHIALYYADGKALKANELLRPRNTFYIFAGEKSEEKSWYGFEINGAMKSVQNGTYFKYTLKEGEQVKLKKGNITGTTMWLKWKQDQPPHYYSIHGFYKEPVVKRTTVTKASKPGRFRQLDGSLGAFLAYILTPQEE